MAPSSPLPPEQDPLAALRPLEAGSLSEHWDRWRLGATRSPGRMVAVAVAVVLVGGALWWLLRPPVPPVESTLPRSTPAGPPAGPAGPGSSPSTTASAGTATTAAQVVVQASGAVGRPGVYPLPAGARVDDVVRSAGGFTPDADVDRVNLAAPVADGERVWLPRRGELAPPPLVAGTPGGASGGAGRPRPSEGPGSPSAPGAEPEVVDLNSADASQLETLPGVGPATAAAILAYRDEHGPFASVDDLLEVRGIGDAKLEALRPLVTV